MSSFAIVHQRSVISVIISDNSSLLLIVWNNLKASGSYFFGWFPAHSNTEELFQVHIMKKKKYKELTEQGQSQGGNWRPCSPGINPHLLNSLTVTISPFSKWKGSPSPWVSCLCGVPSEVGHLMPCWKLDGTGTGPSGRQAGFSFGWWRGELGHCFAVRWIEGGGLECWWWLHMV